MYSSLGHKYRRRLADNPIRAVYAGEQSVSEVLIGCFFPPRNKALDGRQTVEIAPREACEARSSSTLSTGPPRDVEEYLIKACPRSRNEQLTYIARATATCSPSEAESMQFSLPTRDFICRADINAISIVILNQVIV